MCSDWMALISPNAWNKFAMTVLGMLCSMLNSKSIPASVWFSFGMEKWMSIFLRLRDFPCRQSIAAIALLSSKKLIMTKPLYLHAEYMSLMSP